MAGIGEVTEQYITAETLAGKTAQWLEEIAAYRWRKIEWLDPAQSALLVVDMTRPFVDSGRPLASPNAPVILPSVRKLLEAFRRQAKPVIWLIQAHHSVAADRGPLLDTWWPTPILEGTADVEVAEGLSVNQGEKVILKRRYSGFYQTDLELTLRSLKLSSVVICGVLTNVCPYLTAFDAFYRGFQVYFPADATASLNESLHVGALRSIAAWAGYVVTCEEITDWHGTGQP
ncbi:MAG: cysteine hydrolase [Spirochaetaceae bacterium]|nr:MAG: cysteine hydrolase [Spirochaetaceae bacterium]